MDKFKLVSEYKPTGDQPEAIEKLVKGIEKGYKEQVLLGVTGSGKTFTMANVIERSTARRLFLPITRPLRLSFAASSKNFSPKTRWSILLHITIIISPRPISPGPIPI